MQRPREDLALLSTSSGDHVNRGVDDGNLLGDQGGDELYLQEVRKEIKATFSKLTWIPFLLMFVVYLSSTAGYLLMENDDYMCDGYSTDSADKETTFVVSTRREDENGDERNNKKSVGVPTSSGLGTVVGDWLTSSGTSDDDFSGSSSGALSSSGSGSATVKKKVVRKTIDSASFYKNIHGPRGWYIIGVALNSFGAFVFLCGCVLLNMKVRSLIGLEEEEDQTHGGTTTGSRDKVLAHNKQAKSGFTTVLKVTLLPGFIYYLSRLIWNIVGAWLVFKVCHDKVSGIFRAMYFLSGGGLSLTTFIFVVGMLIGVSKVNKIIKVKVEDRMKASEKTGAA